MILYRKATMSDAARLAEINRPYVENTAVTFMCVPPTAETFAHKLKTIMPMYPFIVCEVDGRVMGYAYAAQLRPHEAYQWDVELSIYVDSAVQHQGVGTGLYTRLLNLLKIQGFLNAYAVITVPNEGSIALHEHFGFRQVGYFPMTGYKMGAWRDVVWLCLPLDAFPARPVPPSPFSRFGKSELEMLLL